MLFFSLRTHVVVVVALLIWRGDGQAALGYVALLLLARALQLLGRALHAFGRSYWVALCWTGASLRRVALARERCAHCVDARVAWLEGPIAAGKTTAAAAHDGPVESECVPPALLAEFQRDAKATAALFQLTMDARRRAAWLRTLCRPSTGTLVVHDRALLGSRAFAAWNYVCGSLTRAEYDATLAAEGGESLYATLAAQASGGAPPLLLVLFATPVALCHKRVAARGDSDAATPVRYLAGLSLLHALLLRALLDEQRAARRVVVRAALALGTDARRAGACCCAALGARWGALRAQINAASHATRLELTPAEAARLGELGFDARREWVEYRWLRATWTE